MPTEIRFRLNHLYQGPNAPFLHAADAGLFADHGIAVSFIEGFSSSQVARAIAAGEADAGFGDVSSTFELALHAGSVPVTCLLPVFARSPCCLGYLPQPRALALGDLGGATLCGPDGDTSARLLPLLLARNGLTDLRYTYLAVSPPERDRLVAAREVLAATCFDATLKFAMRSRGYDSRRSNSSILPTKASTFTPRHFSVVPRSPKPTRCSPQSSPPSPAKPGPLAAPIPSSVSPQ